MKRCQAHINYATQALRNTQNMAPNKLDTIESKKVATCLDYIDATIFRPAFIFRKMNAACIETATNLLDYLGYKTP